MVQLSLKGFNTVYLQVKNMNTSLVARSLLRSRNLLPLDEMPVHRRVTPPILNSLVLIYTAG